jgi:hypothetical protein
MFTRIASHDVEAVPRDLRTFAPPRWDRRHVSRRHGKLGLTGALSLIWGLAITACGGGSGTAVSTAVTKTVPAVTVQAATTGWTGHWSVIDVCTSGACKGGTYPGPFDLVQTGNQIAGDNAGIALRGTAAGASATIHEGPGYVAVFHLKMTPDGRRFTGSWTAQNGSGTTTGSLARPR